MVLLPEARFESAPFLAQGVSSSYGGGPTRMQVPLAEDWTGSFSFGNPTGY